jgi:hypothetical protein
MSKDVRISEDFWLYGGRSESYPYAAKGAAHELNGAVQFFNTLEEGGVVIPMQSLVDVQGLHHYSDSAIFSHSLF